MRNGFRRPVAGSVGGLYNYTYVSHAKPNDLPDFIDWRMSGCVTEVKDQVSSFQRGTLLLGDYRKSPNTRNSPVCLLNGL